MVQYFPVITGSLTVNGDLSVTGTTTVSASNSVSSSYAYTASSAVSSYTASSAVNAANAITSSYAYTASSAVNSFSASKAVSSSYADTASFSNDFTVLGNLTVYGTQSIQYITSSQLNVSDNVITVNVASPGVRFGGLSVFDSGSLSSEATASLFWDSQNNHWIYQRESGSTYDGGMLISGPRNAAGLGNEQGTTSCMLLVGQGGDHLTSSMIYHDGARTCFYGNTILACSNNFGSNLSLRQTFTGSVIMTGSLVVNTTGPELQVTNAGVVLGNLLTDNHSVTGSVNVTGSLLVNGLGSFLYNDNAYQGLTIRNINAGNAALAGLSIQNSSGTTVAQMNYVSTVYANTTLRDTFLFNTVAAQKLAFGTNSGGSGTRADIYFSVNPAFTLDSNNPNQIHIVGCSKNVIINYSGTDCSQKFQVNGTALITGAATFASSATFGSDVFTYNNGGIFFSGGGVYSSGIFQNSAGLNLQTCTTPRLIVQTNGNIQIDNGQLNVPKTLYFQGNSTTGCTYGDIKWYNVQWDGNTRAEIVVEGDGALANGRMVFKTGASGANATEKMRITSAGVVTKPFQPFVMGGIASDQTISTSNPTKVNFVTNTGHFGCNVGGHWNNSTYQLTAPATGVYLVNISGYWSTKDMINQFAAFVNSNRKVSIPTGYCTNIAGGSMMVPMTAGETMDFRVYNDVGTGTLYSNVFHTFFSIYLLG